MFPQVQTSVATFPFTISLLSEVSSAPPPQLSDTCGSHSSLTCQSCSPHGCPTISNLQVQHQTHHILLPLLHLPKAPGFHLPVTKAWKFRHPELLILQCLSSHQIHRSFFLRISCSIFPNAFPTLSPLVKLSSYGRSSCQSALYSCTLPFDQLQDVSLDDQPHPHSRILCSPHCLNEAHRPPLGVQGLQRPILYFQPCLLNIFLCNFLCLEYPFALNLIHPSDDSLPWGFFQPTIRSCFTWDSWATGNSLRNTQGYLLALLKGNLWGELPTESTVALLLTNIYFFLPLS